MPPSSLDEANDVDDMIKQMPKLKRVGDFLRRTLRVVGVLLLALADLSCVFQLDLIVMPDTRARAVGTKLVKIVDADAKFRNLANEISERLQSIMKGVKNQEPQERKSLQADPSVDVNGRLSFLPLGGLVSEPTLEQHVVRVFISSTFTDTNVERNLLIACVDPLLRKLATQFELEFVPSEMRWGISNVAITENLGSEICIQEIKQCQRDSAGINFVIILGERSGWRPVPGFIKEGGNERDREASHGGRDSQR